MKGIYQRLRLVLMFRKLRIEVGVPMQNWWIELAWPYILSGKMPKFDSKRWKIWDGGNQ
jgi:hypothetical protein